VDAVADDDLSIGIVRARHPDAQADRPAVVLPFLLYSKRCAARLGDLEDVDVKPGRASLRGIVLKRQIANDSVPLAREANREVLDDVECAVGMNGELRIEVADADRPPLRARGAREREEEKECFADR
jgi:hypothetical protein